MKIVINRNNQHPQHTIDTKDCRYTYAIIEAFRLAMELDGFSEEAINEVFLLEADKECVQKLKD